MTDLSDARYNDENAAREHVEALLWKNGRFCLHCGTTEGTVEVEGRKKSHRPRLYYCNACGKTFTVTVGTLFERSHVPLHKWLLAIHLRSATKKGMSSHQHSRMLGVTYKTAWFMSQRIGEAMNPDYPGPPGKEAARSRPTRLSSVAGRRTVPRASAPNLPRPRPLS